MFSFLRKRIFLWTTGTLLTATAALTANWEGLRLSAYRDPIGVPTICYGATLGVKMGQTATKEECERRLQEDLQKHWNALKPCLTREIPFTAAVAALDLAFNVGSEKVCRSTFVRLINAGAPPEVYCQELDKWVFAGGQKLRGLVKRREAFKQICLGNMP